MRLTPRERAAYKEALAKVGWTQAYYAELLGYKSLGNMQRSKKYKMWVTVFVEIINAYDKG